LRADVFSTLSNENVLFIKFWLLWRCTYSFWTSDLSHDFCLFYFVCARACSKKAWLDYSGVVIH